MNTPESKIETPAQKHRTGRRSSKQLAEALGRAIERGRWPVGSRLPSTREFGRRFGASRATVQRALRSLEKRGWIECRARSGWYVAIDRHENDVDPLLSVRPVTVTGDRSSVTQIAFHITNTAPSTFRSVAGETWIGSITAGLRECLDKEHVDLLMLTRSEEGPTNDEAFLERLDRCGSTLGGLIVTQPFINPAIVQGLDQRDLPWITINRAHASQTSNFVSADNFNDGYRIGFIFARTGYQRLLMLSGYSKVTPSSREKIGGVICGYLDATGHAPDAHQVMCEDSPEEYGYKHTRAFLEKNDPPDGIFACGDLLAIGAIRACTEAGLRVPRDVGVVGSTGLELGQYTQPRLTITTQPGHVMGEEAARLLLHMARTGVRRVPGRAIPGELIVRESLPVSEALLRESAEVLSDMKFERL